MTMRRTYLDHNASVPLRPEARAAVVAALEVDGNPSSVHAEGRRARAIVEAARDKVAALVGARPADVVFVSGASEGNNAVLAARWATIIAAGIEHASVLGPIAASGALRVDLGVTSDGVVTPAALEAALAKAAPDRTLLALQLANNETGVVQPVAELSAIARAKGVAVLCDAVQGAGRLAIDFAASGVDYMTLSAHKLGGPKGVGAVIIRDGAPLPAFITGGGQERRRRAGTESVALIAGFGAAAEAARRDLADMARLARLRDRLERAAIEAAPGTIVIGRDAPRLANTTMLALEGHAAETLVIQLDLAGIAVSAGAACSSGKVGPSHVLAAMGVASEIARSAVRVSLGWSSSDEDVDAFISAWAAIAERRERRKVA